MESISKPALQAITCIFVSLVLLILSARAETVVRIPAKAQGAGKHDAYYHQLLNLALTKTIESHGPYSVVESVLEVPVPARGERLLRDGVEIDVIWMLTDKDAEEQLRPIRVPLLRGLSGLRLLLIHQEQQEAFARMKSLQDLRALRSGEAKGHLEIAIMRANQLQVIEASDSDGCLHMLEKKRFDYLPVSICSPLAKQDCNQAKLRLMIEPHLLIWYPSAVYFFVNRHQEGLATRLEKGLMLAVEDGSLNKIFREFHEQSLVRLHDPDRRVIRLHNPLLPDATPLDHEAFWFDVTAEMERDRRAH